MAVERTFRCDGPDCEASVKTQGPHPHTFLTVHEEPGFPHEQGTEMHFCGWDCAMKFGARFEPPERIDLGDPDAA